MAISKEDAELLYRLAWRDAKAKFYKGISKDDWDKQVFDVEYKKCNSTKDGVKKAVVKEVCSIIWWDAKVNKDHYHSFLDWYSKRYEEIMNHIIKFIEKYGKL